jgi:hypothetical protein
MGSFSFGSTVKPRVVATSRPFGLIFYTVHVCGYFKVRSFQHSRNQTHIIPQATIVGLAGKLSIVQANKVVALVFLHAFTE